MKQHYEIGMEHLFVAICLVAALVYGLLGLLNPEDLAAGWWWLLGSRKLPARLSLRRFSPGVPTQGRNPRGQTARK
jgi:hypothetical protein